MQDITGEGKVGAGGIAGAVGRVTDAFNFASGGGVCAGAAELFASADTVVSEGPDAPDAPVAPTLSPDTFGPVAPEDGGGGLPGVFVGTSGLDPPELPSPLVVFLSPSGLEDVALASRCSVTRVIVKRNARVKRTPRVRLRHNVMYAIATNTPDAIATLLKARRRAVGGEWANKTIYRTMATEPRSSGCDTFIYLKTCNIFL